MKAAVHTNYGSPDVLRIEEIPKPIPADNEVLIKIHVTTVESTDAVFRQGSDLGARLFFAGLFKPKFTILGNTFGGEIEAIGKDVKLFTQGDQIFGATISFGAHAEYISLPEDEVIAIKPDSLSYEEIVPIPSGAVTALFFLRDGVNIQRGQKVLIIGASGGIGTAAVQLAKHFGADVTGVCSTANVDLVKSLGADKVIDYKKEDFTKNSETYDIIFDTVGKSSFSHSKHSLKQEGIYLTAVTSLTIMIQMLWTSRFGNKKAMIVLAGLKPISEKKEALAFILELVEVGKIKTVIDKRYHLEEIVEAHRHVETGHKKGNVIITVAHNN